MDAVNAFNQELFSMIDMKPPISRAKMISITKSAIKAIKLYKHVVQIVEKFIKKCKPELKVPGLYVVDSIVRQSRHQFGADKDVFGPRFTKNITGTFQNLYLCPAEDKSKIVRVLNLWQKNGVFKIEIIQPLLDMAAGAGGNAGMPDVNNGGPDAASPASQVKVTAEPPPSVMVNSIAASMPQLQNSEAFAAVAQLFQSSQGQQLQQILQSFQQSGKTDSPAVESHVAADTAVATAQSIPPIAQPAEKKAAFDKKLLDRFDYDDEPEGGEEAKKEEAAPALPPFGLTENTQQPVQLPMYPQLPAQVPSMEQFQTQVAGLMQDSAHQVSFPPNGQLQACGLPPAQLYPAMMQPVGQPLVPQQMGAGPQVFMGGYPPQNEMYPQQMAQRQPQPQQMSMEIDQPSLREGKHRPDGRKSRSRSGSRSPKRRRSRSNSRSRRSRYRRSWSRSRSRERRRSSPRSRSRERDRERERERRQRGLPHVKSATLSVCSTTLWVGQLDKRTQQQDVACLLEEFGQIESINMIPPRGCAYIVMVHRQDAFRALQKLSRGPYKVNQKAIKIAWALNKGIKPEYKQYWDVELGVTYIPWNKVKREDLESFREGGMLDADSICPEWQCTLNELEKASEVAHNGGLEPAQAEEAAVATHAQMPSVQSVGVVGAVPPPTFPTHMGLPPPSFPPGVPPPPPPPFLRPGFNPMQMPPGFLPPGAMPPMGSTGPPAPTPIVSVSTSVIPGSSVEDSSKGPRNSSSTVDRFPAPGTNQGVGANLPTPVPQQMAGNNQMGGPGGPVMSPQAPTGGLLGARPGMIPLQRPPGVPPPHLQRFPPPRPNMPPMPPQMMHRGPPPGGYGMPPPHPMRGPFPPHGPPFMREPPRGPEGPDDQFRNERPGFGRDREHFRGRRPFGRGGGEGRDHYGNRPEESEQQGGWEREGRDWGHSPETEDRGHHRGRHWDRERDRGTRERDSRWDRDGRKEKGDEAEGSGECHQSNSAEHPVDSGKELPREEPSNSHSEVTVDPQVSLPIATTEPTEKPQEAES
ncbi:hypothetical protein MATL_G00121920 [Megalops atlanticus]|uniref:Splicing factor, arginine/serine-rich 15 n=1 Tax=Megalops atlanticus TaxID=7932 RepID=A0A9D3Q0E2_MEGAT|nr:hypothetical protein MATL_G00121920 [Megalops atlanticus]